MDTTQRGEGMSDKERCQNDNCGGTLAEDGACPACEIGPANPEAAWNAWVDSRPESIREIVRRLSPRTDFRIDGLGDDYYRVRAISEDGTVRALRISATTGTPMWEVFGLDPDELTAWRTHPWSDITPN